MQKVGSFSSVWMLNIYHKLARRKISNSTFLLSDLEDFKRNFILIMHLEL
jgi:hypothetical protein